ncbi:hypothetical protein P153DRAFT_386764 [Dothidotthia symphoricarpi CBS 119687]|uniref:Uncharacterized protein n=1 Tax=Dothidotthia symphoricarpi CBS 119687 TaxID=1392245 RepID=A0A6A6AD30_9PLEO|nr:uncharacterized protein P153DRAFT_386764 [Dothidotthia symphoricarpi CBS 119687]KAF2128651.1 hypothetical protein P153DRAFT_386764 [Dothidotthia symphoricarpi CBS 119687]
MKRVVIIGLQSLVHAQTTSHPDIALVKYCACDRLSNTTLDMTSTDSDVWSHNSSAIMQSYQRTRPGLNGISTSKILRKDPLDKPPPFKSLSPIWPRYRKLAGAFMPPSSSNKPRSSPASGVHMYMPA